MRLTYIVTILFASILIASVSFAGHHYSGHGYGMSSWNMEDMDSNQDGTLSFDEYSEANRNQLRKGFDMIDANKDGVISENEWATLLEVHGVMSN